MAGYIDTPKCESLQMISCDGRKEENDEKSIFDGL
jgi:hypothetical protein